MKELFNKLSTNFEAFKEKRLVYGEQKLTPEQISDAADEAADDAAYDQIMREDRRQEEADRLKGFKAPKVELYGEGEEEAGEADEATKINDAIDYAKELMNDISWVGKINYKPPKFIDQTAFSFHHYIDMFKPSSSSELSPEEKEEIGDKIAKVGKFISEVQGEMFDKKLESEEWQKIVTKTKVYQRNVKLYFNKLNKPLNRMSRKERKEFVLYIAAFLDEGADEHAKNFVAEMLTSKRPRNIIAKYGKPVPAKVARVAPPAPPETDEEEF